MRSISTSVALLASISILAACGSDEPTPPANLDASVPRDASVDAGADAGTTDGSNGEDPFAAHLQVWTELREALRASPTHRTREAERVVATGDAQAILDFVRERISTRLASLNAFDTETLWGPDAALRGGWGTPREKVELLATLLEDAGFETEVRWGFVTPASQDALWATVFEPVAADGLPELDPASVERWAALLGVDFDALEEANIVDEDGTESRALANVLRPLVSDPTNPYRVNRPSVRMPFVVFRTPGGEWTAANPNIANSVIGDAYATNDGTPAAAPQPLDGRDVNVRVWARKNVGHDRTEDLELLSKSWTIDRVIGRVATVQFSPILDFRDWVIQYAEDLSLFLPTLQLARTDDDDETTAAASAVGPVISRSADVYEHDGDRITVNGRALRGTPGATSSVAANVATIVARAQAGRFPRVELELRAEDARGRPVAGLLAGDLSITEDGQRLNAALVANDYRPRVVFALDYSLSVRDAIRNGYRQLVLDLAAPLFSDHGAQVMVTALGSSDNDLPYVERLEDLATQIDDDVLGNSSAIFTELADLTRRTPTAIIAISDFDNPDETVTPALLDRARAAPPVLLLGAGTVLQSTVDQLVAELDATYAPIADVSAAQSAIEGFLARWQPTTRFVYRAPADGPTVRTVDIALTHHAVTATAGYSLTSTSGPSAGIVGVYVTIEHDGKSVTRILGGIPPETSVDDATAEDYEDAFAALFGRYSIRFEGGWPTVAMVLDELLAERLSNAPIFRAYGDFDALTSAVDEGAGLDPDASAMLLLAQPARDDDSRTVPMGLRAVLHSQRPSFARSTMRREMDILPFGDWATVHEDPIEGWNRTFERSLHVAVLEAAFFRENTIDLLEGETLVEVAAAAVPDRIDRVTEPELREEWRRTVEAYRFTHTILMPADGRPVAAYAVNQRTGHVTALLAGGAGGTREDEAVEELMERIAMYERIEAGLSALGVETGFWVKFEIAKAKVLAAATIAIIKLEGWDPTPEWDPEITAAEAACGFAEDKVKDAILGAIPSSLGGAFTTSAIKRIDAATKALFGEAAIPSACKELRGG